MFELKLIVDIKRIIDCSILYSSFKAFNIRREIKNELCLGLSKTKISIRIRLAKYIINNILLFKFFFLLNCGFQKSLLF